MAWRGAGATPPTRGARPPPSPATSPPPPPAPPPPPPPPPPPAAAARARARQMALAAPFILLAGSLDEESAVEYMKAGATDYILKDRLARLGPAVRAALDRKRMKQQLDEREEYFRSLIEQAMDIIAVLDPEGALRYASPSVLPLLGYVPEDLVGLSIFALVHPDD